MNRLIIIGAGGHGKVICDIALKNRFLNITFSPVASVKSNYKTHSQIKKDVVH